jgi:hypothetical protein
VRILGIETSPNAPLERLIEGEQRIDPCYQE